jgi:hypothetical protein
VAAVAAIWRGDTIQLQALLTAIEHHCACKELRGCCPAHAMLLEQRQIDHLLFLQWLFAHEAEARCDV